MPDLSATREMVVDSPPGRMSASHRSNSDGVRTSMKLHCILLVRGERDGEEAANRRSWMCSEKAPWRARTPIVMARGGEVCVIVRLAVA